MGDRGRRLYVGSVLVLGAGQIESISTSSEVGPHTIKIDKTLLKALTI